MSADRLPRSADIRPLTASLLAVVVGVLPAFLTASLAVQIGHSFAFSAPTVGLAFALFHVVGVITSPTISRLITYTGVGGLLRLSAFAAAASSLGIALFAHSSQELICLLMFAGLANGAAGPTATALLRARVSRERHGIAFGIQQSGAPAGVLVAGLALPAVALPFGWRWAFGGVVALAAVAAAVVPSVTSDPRALVRAQGATRERPRRDVLILLVVAAASASAVGNGVVSFLVVFSMHSGMSASAGGFLLAAVSLGAIFGRTIFALRADRGRGDPIPAALPLMLACTCGVTMLAGGSPFTIVPGALMIGCLGWCWHGVLILAAVRHNHDAPIWAVGILMSAVFIGAISGPLLVGSLAANAGFPTAWSTCALISLVPVAVVEMARRQAARVTRSTADPARSGA